MNYSIHIKVQNAQVSDTTTDAIKYQSLIHKNSSFLIPS
ncbi:hypothetical protein BH11BAC6_BH11BAC6_05090 [soil metagenome]